MEYLVGIARTFLFEVSAVRVDVDEENDSILFFDKDKKVVFVANKMDLDFIIKINLEEFEIPDTLKRIYKLGESSEEEPQGESEDMGEEEAVPNLD